MIETTLTNGRPGSHCSADDTPTGQATAGSPPQPADPHLKSLEEKLQQVRDYTTGVARGYFPGHFVWGAGGIGKSHTVVRQLAALGVIPRKLNARATGWGLFCHLERYPSSVTLIEDAESMYGDRRALGVLRAALDCQRRDGDRGPIERWVTWAGDSGGKKMREVLFSGGIIVLSNTELPAGSEVQALKTRIPYLHLAATDEEIRALMRSVAADGYVLGDQAMTPAECAAVCRYLEDQAYALRSPLNMRLLVNAYAAYLLWRSGESGTHWRDMVRGAIREQPPPVFTEPVTIRKPPGRADRKAEHQQIVRQILAQTQDREERLQLWREQTGLGQTAFYDRRAEVAAEPE